ncbi:MULTISPECIES: hypothetical protein [Streptomyces]|nr:hypothetical protein [Streptomyces solaniscabiei]
MIRMFFCAKCTHPGFHATEGGTKTTCEHCPACEAKRREAATQSE